MDTTETPTRRGPLLPILATVLYVIALPVAGGLAITSFMLFDSTTMEEADTWILLAFYGIWTLVFVLILAIPATWIAWAFTRNRAITIPLITALIPLIPAAVVAYAMVISL
jgi:hypothetical protein